MDKTLFVSDVFCAHSGRCLPLKISHCSKHPSNSESVYISRIVSVVPSNSNNVDLSDENSDCPAHVTFGSDSVFDSIYVLDICVNDDDLNNQ